MAKSLDFEDSAKISPCEIRHSASSLLGMKISKALCSNNITIEEFALAMSTTVNVVNKWLMGDYEFSPRLIDRIKEKLNISGFEQVEIFDNAPVCNLNIVREQLRTQSEAYHQIFLAVVNKLD